VAPPDGRSAVTVLLAASPHDFILAECSGTPMRSKRRSFPPERTFFPLSLAPVRFRLGVPVRQTLAPSGDLNPGSRQPSW
jgi:hypothetical protein